MLKIIHRMREFVAENLLLIAILVSVSISILARAYFFGWFISPDSTHYLRAAREILRGNGFYVYSDSAVYPYTTWFGVWPIGYPFLIAATSFITRTEIYLASKILSIIIVWIIGLTLYKRFGRTAWGYALVMLNVGFLRIFCHTWSEVTFILGLVLFSFWVSDIITEDTVKLSQYIKLTFGVLLLFLSRYIGAFAVGVIGLLWIYNVYLICRHKDKTAKKRVFYLSISGVFSGFFIATYLLVNREMTGYMTGMERVPINDAGRLLLNLGYQQLIEIFNVFNVFNVLNIFFKLENKRLLIIILTLPLLLFFVAIVIYTFLKNFKEIKMRSKSIITPLVFIVMGGIYWCAIVAMRFTAQFDDFSYRLLFPSSTLFFIGFIGLLVHNKKFESFLKKYSRNSKLKNNIVAIFAIALISYPVLHSLYLSTRITNPSVLGYREMKQSMLSSHAHILDGAIVLWGERFLLFLRDNLTPLNNSKIHNNEIQRSYLGLFKDYNEIYIYIPGMKDRMYDNLKDNEELFTFFEQYRDSEEIFVRIK